MIGKLRFILRITGTFIACVILWAYAITVRAFARNNPKTRYHLLCKGMRAYGYVVGWIIGMTIRVHGTPPKAPFFLVSNHISYTDILLLCATSPAWFVSNAEVAKWPGIGALTRSTNTLFIDRETRRDVHRVNRLIANLVRQDSGVVFYPEGTTSDGTAVLPFKPSLLQPAIELGMPIHCAAIAYTAPPCSELVAWHGDTDFGSHATTLLSAPGFTAHVHFSDQTLRANTRKQLALDAHTAISTLHRELCRSLK